MVATDYNLSETYIIILLILLMLLIVLIPALLIRFNSNDGENLLESISDTINTVVNIMGKYIISGFVIFNTLFFWAMTTQDLQIFLTLKYMIYALFALFFMLPLFSLFKKKKRRTLNKSNWYF